MIDSMRSKVEEGRHYRKSPGASNYLEELTSRALDVVWRRTKVRNPALESEEAVLGRVICCPDES